MGLLLDYGIINNASFRYSVDDQSLQLKRWKSGLVGKCGY